jgi:rod shape-determining protein MreD
MKKASYYLLTLWGVLWAQVFISHFLGGSFISLDLVLVVTLYYGLSRGPLAGQCLGVVWGLMLDASSMGVMGVHTLLYALVGYTAGMVSRQLDNSKGWTQGLFTFSASVGYLVLYLLLTRLFSSASRSVSWMMAIHPVVNACFAPLIFWLMEQWADLWSMAPLER